MGSNREKSNIAIAIWKNEWLDGTIIITYFGGSNNIFANCMSNLLNLPLEDLGFDWSAKQPSSGI